MKNFNNISIVQITVVCFLMVFIPTIANAQDPGGGPDAPIDGGLSVLIAAGVGYGIKKYREGRKKENQSE